MRFTDEQIRRLAERLLAVMTEQGGAVLKADRGRVQACIEETIRGNLREEVDLDRQARELLEKHLKGAPPDVDRQKLFAMIKKKLAEEKGIPL